MATTSKKKTGKEVIMTDSVKLGPDLKLIQRILNDLFDGKDNPVIPTFGGYREYPIRITGVDIHGTGREMKLTIFGETDYRDYDHPAAKKCSGRRVRIDEYSPHTRNAKQIVELPPRE